MIGSRALFSNQASLLLEMRHPSALTKVYHLFEQAVFVSPRLAAITTAKQADEWAGQVTRLMTEDPLASIEKVRFRKSLHGGRPWVKPELLEKTIRSSIAQATSVSSDAAWVEIELRCFLLVEGTTTSDPSFFISALMRRVTMIVGAAWERAAESAWVRPGTWKAVNDVTGQWYGKIEIHATSVREVDALIAKVHGCGVEVEGSCYTVEIENIIKSIAAIPSHCIAAPTRADSSALIAQGNGMGGPRCWNGADGRPRATGLQPLAKRRRKRIQCLSEKRLQGSHETCQMEEMTASTLEVSVDFALGPRLLDRRPGFFPSTNSSNINFNEMHNPRGPSASTHESLDGARDQYANLPPARMQYTGDLVGASWNTQAPTDTIPSFGT